MKWTFRKVNDLVAACSDHEMPDGDYLAFYICRCPTFNGYARLEWTAFGWDFPPPPLFRDEEGEYVSKVMEGPDLIASLDEHAAQIITASKGSTP